eukprot:g4436.t1
MEAAEIKKPSHTGGKVKPGTRGVFVTCEKDLEKRAGREVFNLLNQFTEELVTDEEPNSEVQPVIDISKALKAEVKELKKKTASLFKTKYLTGVHGSAFIEFSPNAPCPTELVLKALKQVYETGENTFKACIKMLPVTHSCMTDMAQMEALAEMLIPQYFSDDETAPCFEFAVHAQKHCASNPGLKTMDVIKVFANRVNPRHRVNLTHPAKVILVSIVKNLCCVAVVDGADFEHYRKFNVRQCLEKHFDKEASKRKAENDGRESSVKKVNSESEMRVGVEAL